MLSGRGDRLGSRRLVGWSLAGHCKASLIGDALCQALGSSPVPDGLIFHSDSGSQFGSRVYRRLLKQAGIHPSMSVKANRHPNACTESFMGTLKTEMLQDAL